MKEKKYFVGNYINPQWIYVADLEDKVNNKKILCYNPNTGAFKEGWIWDFTSKIITNKPNRNPSCIICKTHLDEERDAFDINANYALACKIRKIISEDILISLRNIREGLIYDEGKKTLEYFNMLLQNKKYRKNKKLSILIQSTYKILLYQGYFNK
jgi:hypothetical protein